ncbi:MAG: hypothetical protein IPH53_07500 [Flavobacteriales bacterium]|nr:hypothetical protein [Flavobacteriales bacterium]
MEGIEEAIIKVYMLQRDSLRERAESMLEHAPDREIPPTWVVPMDVPAVDKLVGRLKPYLYFDRQRKRFTHIVHAFAVVPKASEPARAFPVQRVITIPEALG